jgi:cellulose synthase/poly-beta-1,6-N-acetylglucosamine synthase-like glycosyltransferase
MNPNPPLPLVSVLVAARNEEDNILACLQSLATLTYPADRLDICIGDDNSTDGTAAIVRDFIQDKPHFRCQKITGQMGHTRGKANVLAHLARAARGEVFFVTDADVTVPGHWIETMLAAAAPNVGVVTGVTVPRADGAWAAMQALDWAYALYVVNRLAAHNIPVTTMGNNMAVTRPAYESTGGYENLPFSITEDYQLFREILAKKYDFRQVYLPDAVAITIAMPTLQTWLQQRKRWAYGALQAQWYLRLLLFLPVVLLPLLGMLAWANPSAAGLVWLGFMCGQMWVLSQAARTLQQYKLLRWVWLYPFYHVFGACITLFYYYLPVPTVWKGRRY